MSEFFRAKCYFCTWPFVYSSWCCVITNLLHNHYIICNNQWVFILEHWKCTKVKEEFGLEPSSLFPFLISWPPEELTHRLQVCISLQNEQWLIIVSWNIACYFYWMIKERIWPRIIWPQKTLGNFWNDMLLHVITFKTTTTTLHLL